jgi:hypothetical protein
VKEMSEFFMSRKILLCLIKIKSRLYNHYSPCSSNHCEQSSIKIKPPNGCGIGASTPQSRPLKAAMRSWIVCMAAAEYCG